MYFVRWEYIYTFRSPSLIRILILCVLYIVYLMPLDQLQQLCSVNLQVFGRGCDLFQLITINWASETEENHMNRQIN